MYVTKIRAIFVPTIDENILPKSVVRGGCASSVVWDTLKSNKLFRISHKVNELHKKLSTWLCKSYCVVLIPAFKTQRMVWKRNRKLNSQMARGVRAWSHYAFRQRLLSKAELFPWCTVIVCNEAYTPQRRVDLYTTS